MDSKRWERLQSLFHRASGLPENERSTFLRTECDDDPSLADDVLAMLAESESTGSILDSDLSQLAREVLDDGSIPARIGPYHVLSLLGEGGMGIVYLARRPELDHLVAIKVLRDASLSPIRRERFLREQQTLAQLKHPGIARLYDAAVLRDGTPYIVMEHVAGVPITQYCAQHIQSIHGCLRLFRSACEAVLHAHRQAIIHRDLKPSNILITEIEGTPVVKLLDFGIAKSLDHTGSDPNATRTEFRLMTPAYAAPEQIRNEPIGVYSDVYALGIILFELLTGTHPIGVDGRRADQIEAAILQETLPRPSALVRSRLDGMRHSPPEPNRWADRLSRSSWSDLDVLCMTAMHHDPQRRYSTLEQLIRDLDHFLSGEPLEARPDSWPYRTRKFLRRNSEPVLAAVMVSIVLAGLVLYYTVRLTRETARVHAEAEKARQISEYVIGLFESGDPYAPASDTIDVRTLLRRGVARAEALSDQPIVQAQMFSVLGRVHTLLSDYESARRLLLNSLAIRRNPSGEPLELAETLANLGMLYGDTGEYDSAEVYLREALALRRSYLPPRHPDLATTLDRLGVVLNRQGEYADAEAIYRLALEIRREIYSDPHIDLAASLNNLAVNLFDQGKYAESEGLFREALAIDERVLGPDNPSMAIDLANFGVFLDTMGKYETADSVLTRALDIKRRHLGRLHYETAFSHTQLGGMLRRKGDYTRAEQHLREALEIEAVVLGPDHRNSAITLAHLGQTLRDLGRYEEADSAFERSIKIFSSNLGPQHPYTATVQCHRANLWHIRGSEGAENLFKICLAALEAGLPANHDILALHRGSYGELLVDEGRFVEAEPLLQQSYHIVRDHFGDEHPDTRRAVSRLIDLYQAWNRPDQASTYARLAELQEESL